MKSREYYEREIKRIQQEIMMAQMRLEEMLFIVKHMGEKEEENGNDG